VQSLELFYKRDVNENKLNFIKFHLFLEGPRFMLGSAVLGGFILAMIEGTNILLNRYNQYFMPVPQAEGKTINIVCNELLCSLESPVDLDKGKVDLSVPPIFTSSPGHFS
jgi:hypothetical protein